MAISKHIKVCTSLNFIEHLLILAFVVTECVSVSSFVSFVGIAIGIVSCAVELKICAMASEIKIFESIIKKKRKKHDRVVLLAKTK